MTNCKRAIGAFKQALRVYSPQYLPMRFAIIQQNLGGTFISLAAQENRVNNLWEAVAAFRRALCYFTPHATPLEYAATQHNLGVAYAEYSEGRTVKNTYGVPSLLLSGRCPVRRRIPLRFSMPGTQYTLGLALRKLAEVEDRRPNLERSIAAFEQALRFWTPRNAPALFAQTQANLGETYFQFSTLDDKSACLEKAAAAYRQALTVYSLRNQTMHYLKTHIVLGIVLKQLGRLIKRRMLARSRRYFRRTWR